jgi:hypothetical protein
VEVDQVSAGVVEDRIMPPYSRLAGSTTNTTPFALSRSASRRQSSVRSDRPAERAAGLLERLRRLVGPVQRQFEPVGVFG